VESHRREAWHHTAQVLCLIANVNRDSKKRRSPFKPWEFHPMESAAQQPITSRISWRAFMALLGLGKRSKQHGQQLKRPGRRRIRRDLHG
jgi:hypothetical protein